MIKAGPGFIVSLDYSLINYDGYKISYIMTYMLLNIDIEFD
jgi:hypothetical protein